MIVHNIAGCTSRSTKACHLSMKRLYLSQLYTVFLLTWNWVLQSGDCHRLLSTNWRRPLYGARVRINDGLAGLGRAKRPASSVAMQQCTYERVLRLAGRCIKHAINRSKHLPHIPCRHGWSVYLEGPREVKRSWPIFLTTKFGTQGIPWHSHEIRMAGGWLKSAGKKAVPQIAGSHKRQINQRNR
jgi:hypothetical protein